MEIFSLPPTTIVDRVIPKNKFHHYTNTKQKKILSEIVSRIVWTHKLSPETVNLEGKDIKEIQVFQVELKAKDDIQPLLDIIDKAIPYSIVFVVEYNGHIFLSTSPKHAHPANEDNAVIDYTFKTKWFLPEEKQYFFQLKKSLDAVYYDLCVQLSGKMEAIGGTLHEFILYSKRSDLIEKEILQLKRSIENCKQFNQRVELNLLLKAKEKELRAILNQDQGNI
jgi:hypothetical protein